jgi:putative two-component system response regulator
MDTKRWCVMAVDDEPSNLQLLRSILYDEYDLKYAKDGESALDAISRHLPDIILLDVMMPEMDGYEVCKRLKSDPKTHHIPVIFVTAMSEIEDETKGFDLGAVDYVTKPLTPAVLKKRIETHLRVYNQNLMCQNTVHERTSELEATQRAAIFMLGEAGHFNDTDTGVHIWRMAAYSASLARASGWSVDDADVLELAAPMHDTGKIGIPDEILKAPRKLTAEEWIIMRKHTEFGFKILSKSDSTLFKLAAEIALFHHEKWDGTGYPEKLAGEKIPESARIVAIADVFDALTTKRPYKEPWSVGDAFDLLVRDSGAHFDPNLVEKFIEIKAEILELKQEWDKREAEGKNIV